MCVCVCVCRLELWDIQEARCLAKLTEMCHPLGRGHACEVCALEHLAVRRPFLLPVFDFGDSLLYCRD